MFNLFTRNLWNRPPPTSPSRRILDLKECRELEVHLEDSPGAVFSVAHHSNEGREIYKETEVFLNRVKNHERVKEKMQFLFGCLDL